MRRGRSGAGRFVLALLCAFGVASCGQPAKEPSADRVVQNARVYTVDEARPWAEAVAIRGGEIVYVGDSNGVAGFIGETTHVIDAGGRLVLPGFIDSHTHILETAAFSNALVLNIDQPLEAWLQALREYADANPDLPVIFGYGWIASAFDEAGPQRQMLDAIVADRPVLLRDEGWHLAWANTAALKALNITRDTPDPEPGYSYYKRDSNGEATGYILETAAQHATENIGVMSDENLVPGMARLAALSNSFGITATFDAGISVRAGSLSTREGIKAFLDKVADSGDLTLRIVGSFRQDDRNGLAEAIENAKSWRDYLRGDNYRFDTLKIPYDGTIEARNAAMFEDYQGEPGNSGETAFSQEELLMLVSGAAGEGLDVHVHGLGERGVSDALDAIAKARQLHPGSPTRYTICHVEVIVDDDIRRFADLEVIAQSSPLWASYDDYGQQFVSDDQFQRFWRFADLVNAGARLSLGSDFPATGYGSWGMRPLVQIEVGHTRQDAGSPDEPVQPRESQRLGLAALVRGYTIDAAYQLHMEEQIGSIEVGKKADLIVLDRNIFEIDPYTIHETEVVLTILDGDIVYEMPTS